MDRKFLSALLMVVQVPIGIPEKVIAPINEPTISISSCEVGGCSGQLCVDGSLAPPITTCEWREEYACLQQAVCERQKDGLCGWTYTTDYQACMGGNVKPTPTIINAVPYTPPTPSVYENPLITPLASPMPTDLDESPTRIIDKPLPSFIPTPSKPNSKDRLFPPRHNLLFRFHAFVKSLFKH